MRAGQLPWGTAVVGAPDIKPGFDSLDQVAMLFRRSLRSWVEHFSGAQNWSDPRTIKNLRLGQTDKPSLEEWVVFDGTLFWCPLVLDDVLFSKPPCDCVILGHLVCRTPPGSGYG